MAEFGHIEGFSWLVEEHENIKCHITEQEPGESVRKVNEDHMGLVFVVVLFFKVDVVG